MVISSIVNYSEEEVFNEIPTSSQINIITEINLIVLNFV